MIFIFDFVGLLAFGQPRTEEKSVCAVVVLMVLNGH